MPIWCKLNVKIKKNFNMPKSLKDKLMLMSQMFSANSLTLPSPLPPPTPGNAAGGAAWGCREAARLDFNPAQQWLSKVNLQRIKCVQLSCYGNFQPKWSWYFYHHVESEAAILNNKWVSALPSMIPRRRSSRGVSRSLNQGVTVGPRGSIDFWTSFSEYLVNIAEGFISCKYCIFSLTFVIFIQSKFI